MSQYALPFPTGPALRDAAIQIALDHANSQFANWSEVAFEFVKQFTARYKGFFMTEQLRDAATASGTVPQPPTNRAWGGVIQRAHREKLIKHCGFNQVKNPRAHAATASVWMAV